MKLIGFMLITLSALGCGISINSLKVDRINDLNSFSSMLELMQVELTSHYSPLTLIIEKLTLNLSGSAQKFAKNFSEQFDCLGQLSLEEIWNSCLSNTETYLKPTEIEALASVATVLGKYDVQEQNSAYNQQNQASSCCIIDRGNFYAHACQLN